MIGAGRVYSLALGVLASAAVAGAAASPGREDIRALAGEAWAWGARPRLEIGHARPWAGLELRSDWVDLALVRDRWWIGLGAAQVDAGRVQDRSVTTTLGLRQGHVGVTGRLRHRDVEVTGTAATADWSSVAVLELIGEHRSFIVVFDPGPGAASSFARPGMIARIHEGSLEASLARWPEPWRDGAFWDAGVRIHLHPRLWIGLRADPDQTRWSLGAGHRSWQLNAGRVMDGPREGAVAVALRWQP